MVWREVEGGCRGRGGGGGGGTAPAEQEGSKAEPARRSPNTGRHCAQRVQLGAWGSKAPVFD